MKIYSHTVSDKSVGYRLESYHVSSNIGLRFMRIFSSYGLGFRVKI